MALDFRTQMFGGDKRKINNQPVVEVVLLGLYSLAAISASLLHITFRL